MEKLEMSLGILMSRSHVVPDKFPFNTFGSLYAFITLRIPLG